jgi:hypothetical protein
LVLVRLKQLRTVVSLEIPNIAVNNDVVNAIQSVMALDMQLVVAIIKDNSIKGN